MSTRKPTEDERQFRLAQEKQRMDFAAGREPPRKLNKREREERQRQFELERKDKVNRRIKSQALDAQRKAAERNLGPPTNPYDFLYRRIWDLLLQEGRELLERKPAPVDPIASAAPPVKHALAGFIALRNELVKQALVELVASDVPLDPDPDARRAIAREMARLYGCERRLFESERERSNPKWRDQRDLEIARVFQANLENYRGMTRTDAEQVVADMIGLSVDTLRQRRRRARKQKRVSNLLDIL